MRSAEDPRPRRSGPGRIIGALTLILALALLAGACSGDEGAAERSSTTTTRPPVSEAPPASVPAEAEEPPQPEWIVQIGSAADDSLAGIAAREDEVVAVGFTDGTMESSDASAGARDLLVAVVGTDAEVRSIDQAGGEGSEEAFGVGSASGITIACGSVDNPIDAQAPDAWCAPIDSTGVLEAGEQRGSTEPDQLLGAAVVPDGAFGYASGYTLGLFPDSADTSAGVLGAGDVVLWQVTSNGSPGWIRQFGTGALDRGEGVAATPENDALIVGYTEGDLDGPSHGGQDGFIARYEQSGLPRWTRQFGTNALDRPRAVATGGDPTRGTETYVVVGETEGALAPAMGGERTDIADAPRLDGQEPAPSNAGGVDAMVYAVDPSGERRWAAQLGSEGTDQATGVAVDGQTVLVAGTTTAALDTTGAPAAGGADGFLAAFDLETGALRWITQFGSEGEEAVRGLTVTEDGLAVVAGSTSAKMGDQPNAGGTDGFLIAFRLPASGGSVASSL